VPSGDHAGKQRLVRPDDRLRIAAIGIGDDELEAAALPVM
jgi:hypothetical protein